MQRNPRIIKEKRNKKIIMHSGPEWRLFRARDVHLKCDDVAVSHFGTKSENWFMVRPNEVVLNLSICSPFFDNDINTFSKFKADYDNFRINMDIENIRIESNLNFGKGIPEVFVHLEGIPKVEAVYDEK